MSSVAGSWTWPCGRTGFGVPLALEGTVEEGRLRGEDSVREGCKECDGGRTSGEFAIVRLLERVKRDRHE